jgi:hypothetical protein
MAHCCNETFEEKTRWVSSQVVGESTAQTVTTKSIAFMLISLALFQMDNTGRYDNRRIEVSLRREKPEFGRRPASGLKVDAKYQPRLVAVEIDEIEAGG